jgi:flagellar biosynthetic protein FliQ
MNIDSILYLGEQAMFTTLLVAAPMLAAGMVVGLVVSILQSVTQIQEVTLSFVPKIVAVMVVFLVFMPWMSGLLTGYIRDLFNSIPEMVRGS